ncbi:MAG: hypothetical protein LGB71_01890, partial [Sulfurovum sp.]|nr:hypothetical protein [Sulfurovum sp.]
MKLYLQWLISIVVIAILGACGSNVIRIDNTNNTTKDDTNTTRTTPLCEVPYKDITYGCVTSQTGRIWLDRNIGAARVATSSP